jgi:FKBP-type peptidyl-prolyl cis-trans isomerase
MTRNWPALVGVLLLLSSRVNAEEAPVLKNQMDRMNYAIGVEVARSIKISGVEANLDLIIKGMKDALSGENLLMTYAEVRQAMNEMKTVRIQAKNQARFDRIKDSKKNEEAFLADNMTKEGVVTLPSGLQYRILKTGDGRKPSAADTVECSYRGKLIDGTELDSNAVTGKSMIAKISGGVIPGLGEALKLMPVGSAWQVVIPSRLAYGEKGYGTQIGPNETLIYEIELIAIK